MTLAEAPAPLTPAQREKLLLIAAAKRAGRRLYNEYNDLYDYKTGRAGVYVWQAEFHNAGAKNRERLLMAANRVGKCATIRSYIETTQGPKSIGELLGRRFRVWAWDGSGMVSADALMPFEKDGLHHCFRIVMVDGSWIEVADCHRLLTVDGWRFVSALLPKSGAFHHLSIEGRDPSIRVADDGCCSGTPSDSMGDYWCGSRRYDERPHAGRGFDRVGPQWQADAQGRSLVWLRADVMAARHTNSLLRVSSHPSIRYANDHRAGRSFEFAATVSCTPVPPNHGTHQEFPQPATVEVSGFQSNPAAAIAILPGATLQSGPCDLLSYDGNQVDAIYYIGRHKVYDFHVPGFENYCAAGLIHHNSRTGAAEVAMHAIGEYPPWWKGRKYTRPVEIWVGSESTEASRDIAQKALLGPINEYGTGWIPKANIASVKNRQAGVSDVAETIIVRHRSGRESRISFKTYEQGRKAWQGTSLDIVWADELIPMDVYTEALTRLLDRRGMMISTFTPMAGASEVVQHFMQATPGSSIWMKNVTWDDAPHIDPEERESLWQSYPAYERDARSKGTPMLGTGAVFAIGQDEISVPPFEIPAHFARINGIDFGIDHPAAGGFLAWDRDEDTIYLYDCYKRAGETAIYHAAAMRKHGDWIPTAWPHDGMQRDKGSGEALKNQYRAHGLYMLKDYAQYPDGRGNNVEPGILEMYEYMRTGKLKVFATCGAFFEEMRLYHRKDGQIVKKNDDVISATRYAFMMRRFARTKPIATAARPRFTGPALGSARWKRVS